MSVLDAARPRGGMKPGFWTFGFGALVLLLLYVTVMRFWKGLGATTNLSDSFPWGIWIGFDILCGVGLAAGAFTIMATVHLFHIQKFEPIVRPTLLTGYLGYLLVCVGLMYDLGQPWRIWHAIVYWNEHSVMFEVAWCVMLYTTVLTLEFSHIVFERLQWKTLLKVMHAVSTPLVILGVLLSTLHQSSLGTMYLIVPEKLHPLWYTQLLPLLFYISAIGAGLGMIIVESFLSGRAFGRELEMELLEPLGRVMMVVLGIYGVLRLDILVHNGAITQVFAPIYESRMFLGEFVLGVLLPIGVLAFPRVRRSKVGLVVGAAFAVLGFVMYRLNVSITGFERASGTHYVPSWMEMTVSIGLVAIGFAAFAVAARVLPIFPAHGAPARGGVRGH
jgi:Ni/Fe-hydrogenase subunit HybB-like protein